MRDPKRIEKLLQLLRCYWLAHPDLRLGQILGNFCKDNMEPYYIEDDTVEKMLTYELEKMSLQ